MLVAGSRAACLYISLPPFPRFLTLNAFASHTLSCWNLQAIPNADGLSIVSGKDHQIGGPEEGMGNVRFSLAIGEKNFD